jgi:hypothetical protein
MTEFTDYNRYELPEPFNINERNEWGRILNNALDQFDDDIIRRGPLSSRPSADESGRLFLDTDSDTFYRDDGDNWVQFGAQLTITDSDAAVEVNPTTIDFDTGLSGTNPSTGTVEIGIDVSEFVGRGTEGDGSNNIRVDEDVSFTFTQQIDFSVGLDTRGDIVDDTQLIWDTSAQEIPDSAMGSIDNSTLTNSSLTLDTGDGLKNGATVSLGSTLSIDVEPADFAGTFLSDDGSDNLDVNIGRGLENDGTSSIRVDEDTDFTFTAAVDFNTGLDTSGDITDGTQVIWDSSAGHINQTELENDTVTYSAGDGLTGGGSVALGGAATLDIEPTDFAGSYLSDDGADNLRVDIGRGLEGDGSGNIQVNEDTDFTFTAAVDFTGGLNTTADITDDSTVIWDSSAGYIVQSSLQNDSITISSGDGLKGGATVALGESNTLNVEPNDFAGSYLSDDGNDNLLVDIGRGLEGDGSGNIRVDEDTDFTFTKAVDFSSGLNTTDDITDGATVIWDSSASYIPQGRLQNDSITVSTGDGLKGGSTISLGGSNTINVEPSDFAGGYLTDDGSDNLRVDIGRGLEGDGSGNIRVDEDTDFTFTANVDFNTGLDTSADITDGTTVIWDSSAAYIPQGRLQNDSITLSTGDGLKGGSTISLGGSNTINIEPSDFAGTFLSDGGNDNLQVDINFGLTGDGSGNITLDESVSPTWTGSHTFNGGVTMGSNVDFQGTYSAINVPDPSDPDELANKSYVDSTAEGLNLKEAVVVATHDNNIDLTSTADPNPIDGYTVSDGERVMLKHQTDATENGIYDAVNATDPTTWVRSDDMDEDSEVVEGAFAFIKNGTTHANDSFIITTSEPITLGSTAIEWSQFASAGEISGGDGLKKDGQILNIEPADFAGAFLTDDGSDNLDVNVSRGLENDGAGNIRVNEDTDFTFSKAVDFSSGLDTSSDITDGATVVWDSSASHVPQSSLENDSITISSGDGLKGGSTVSLGGSNTLNVEPNDFAGNYLSDDGNDNLNVNIGRGLENDGSGNIQFNEDTGYTFTTSINFNSGLDTSADITDGTTVIWDSSTAYIPQGRLENDSITISSGDGLKGGATVTLGGTNTLNVEPADFAGSYLSDDGSDNLQVDIGRGLENDGSGSIRVDEDTDYTFSKAIDFNSGLDTSADISDGATVVWDSSGSYVPQSSLQNDSITISAGDGLKGGSTVALGGSNTLNVEPNDFAGSYLSDDGNDNLNVNIGLGLENDGAGNIRVDEDTDFTFTKSIDFNAGFDTSSDITDGSTVIWDSSASYVPQGRLQNDTITLSTGDGLKGGSSVSLGGSNTISVEPANFAGAFLTDDGSDNLDVNIGRGLENDGSGSIRFDEDTAYAFTSAISFGSDIDGGTTNGALEIDEKASLGDSDKAQLSGDANVQGYAMIQDVTNSQSAMVYLGGSANIVEILHDSGAGNEFTTTEGNQGTTNVYYDSTNGQYEINNETGGSATYSLQIMKA